MRKIIIIIGLVFSLNHLISQDLFKKVSPVKLKTEREKHLYNILATDKTTLNLTTINFDYKNVKSSNFTFEIEGKIYTIKDYRIEERSESNYSVFANLKGLEGHIYLTVLDEDVLGNILINLQYYEIKTVGKGKYILRKYDQTKYPDCGNTHIEMDNSKDIINGSKPPLNNTNSVYHNKLAPVIPEACNLRIMVIYTPAVTSAVGNPINLCQQSIDLLNQTFINSNIIHRVELAYAGEENYTESGNNSTDLYRFGISNDGFMDNIHNLRNTYSADICVLLSTSNTGGTIAGIAPAIFTDQNHSFCQVNHIHAVNNITFAHEIGHLLGARHNNDANITPFAFGHGFENTSQGFRTIMAVLSSSIRLPNWSNPNISFIGFTTGNSSSANNAGVLNLTIGDFRTFRGPLNTLSLTNTLLNDNTTGSIVVQNIETSGSVNVTNSMNIDLQASNSITMKDGFTASAGSNFIAQIIHNHNCQGNPNAGGTANGGSNPSFDILEIPSSNSLFKVNVFPNPTNRYINVTVPNEHNLEPINISLLDISGRLLLSKSIFNIEQIDFEKYSNGVFFLNVKVGNNSKDFKILYNQIH